VVYRHDLDQPHLVFAEPRERDGFRTVMIRRDDAKLDVAARESQLGVIIAPLSAHIRTSWCARVRRDLFAGGGGEALPGSLSSTLWLMPSLGPCGADARLD
jgi:hypothetical protein